MPIKIFCCYARADQQLLNGLKAHLMPLQRQGVINLWSDTDIGAGEEWEREISHHLNKDDIILLLISSDFIASEYCYGKEMQRAMERHKLGEVKVIPIILRPVYWQETPFGKLEALPADAVPVISPRWHSIDEALLDVAEGIRNAIYQKAFYEPDPSIPTANSASQIKKAHVMKRSELPVHRRIFVVSQFVRVKIDIAKDGSYVLEGTPARSASTGDEILPTQDDLLRVYARYGIYQRNFVDAMMAPVEGLFGPLINGRRKNIQGWKNTGTIAVED